MYLNICSEIAKCRPKIQKLRSWLIFSLVSFCFSFSAGATFKREATLRFRVSEDLESLDWGYGEVTSLVIGQLMEGLTSIDSHGKPQPALATHWSSSKDAAQYVFQLNPKAHWSDGKQVCSAQFVDAWKRATDRSFASPYSHLFFDIEQMSAEGCDKLVIKLHRPNRYLPSLVSHWVFFPIRKDLIERFGSGWTKPENLVVTGPFVLEKWEPSRVYKMRRNPSYFGPKPRIERLEALVVSDDMTALNLFNSGHLHWMKDLPYFERPKLMKRAEFSAYETLIGYHLGFLMTGSEALPKSLRCALSHSLEKNEIPEFLHGKEVPAIGIVPPALAPQPPSSKAQEKPAVLDNEQRTQSLELHYYAKEIHEPLAQWLQQQWKQKLGIKVKLVRSEGKTYWTRLGQDPPALFLSGITAAYAHPYSFLSEFVSGAKANWGRFSSEAYDAASRKAALEEKDAIYRAQHILIEEECAIIPLYFRSTGTLAARQWAGISMNPMGHVHFKRAQARAAKNSY